MAVFFAKGHRPIVYAFGGGYRSGRQPFFELADGYDRHLAITNPVDAAQKRGALSGHSFKRNTDNLAEPIEFFGQASDEQNIGLICGRRLGRRAHQVQEPWSFFD